MHDQFWPEEHLDYAASNAARRFDLDDSHARELVEMVVEGLEEGGDALEDVAWEAQEHDPRIDGQQLIEDVADSLGYDEYDLP